MRDICGYQGPAAYAPPFIPFQSFPHPPFSRYWDWSLDAEGTKKYVFNPLISIIYSPYISLVDSPVFDATYGFGGTGSGSRRCITTGPFNTTVLHLGPGTAITDHCITRSISNSARSHINAANVQTTLSRTTFETFRTYLENGPTFAGGTHGGGHITVGGEMTNVASSPGGTYPSLSLLRALKLTELSLL